MLDVPKPDYTEIRSSLPIRNSPAHAALLDPRLRRLIDPSDELCPPAEDLTPSLDTSRSPPQHDWTPHSAAANHKVDDTADTAFVVSKHGASLLETTKQHTTTRSSVARTDPRRKFQETLAQAPPPLSNPANASLSKIPNAHQLDTQAVHSSEWYKELSSKHKIMVNQQMAIVAAELRKFHSDPSPDKVFDLTFVRQNQMLQQVLTQLGTYIDENGHFVQVEDNTPGVCDSIQNRLVFDDFSAHPPHPTNFVRPPPPAGQQMHHHVGGFRPDSHNGHQSPSFGMRPGLLGLAPASHPNDFNAPPFENASGGPFDNGHINPFNQMHQFVGRPSPPPNAHNHLLLSNQAGGNAYSERGANNHRWNNNQTHGNKHHNRRPCENSNQRPRE